MQTAQPSKDSELDTYTFPESAAVEGVIDPNLSRPQIPTNKFGDKIELQIQSGEWIRGVCMGHQWNSDGTLLVMVLPNVMNHIRPLKFMKVPPENVRPPSPQWLRG